MAARGVHFAIAADQEARLLAAIGDDESVVAIVDEIEEAWDLDNLVESDKAWDPIHRCFCDGKLLYEGGDYPLNHLICGGRQLLVDDDAEGTVSYVSASQVKDIAAATAAITKEDLLRRYGTIKQRGYQFRLGNEDFEYAWENFIDVATFFRSAANAERAVIFTTDC